MATTNELRFRIGVFVLAAMLLFGVLILLFGGLPTALKPQDRYYIVFDHAPGVTPGTPVRRSGVRIGQVQRLDLDDNTGKVRVTISIERPHHLYEGDQPVLISGALSGDTTIDFIAPQETKPAAPQVPKSEDRKQSAIQQAGFQVAQLPQQKTPAAQPGERVPVAPGTEFKGISQADVSTLIRQVSQLTPPARDAMVELQKALEIFEKMTPLFEETMREFRDLSKTSREMIPELRRANEEIQATSRSWGRLGERVDVLLQTNQDKLVKTLDNMNDTLTRVGSIFNDENLRNLSSTLKNVSAGSKNLESLSKNTEEFLRESRTTIRHINDSLTTTDQILNDVQRATRPLADRTGTITKNLDESTARLAATMAQVQEMLRYISQGDGTIRRFIDDPSLYNNLNESACGITRMLPRLDRILKDFEVFADKIARHPESLGVRGAVAPSSGLKESPFRSSYPDH
jgi:ABC-type transporter Mla subunit MlaD